MEKKRYFYDIELDTYCCDGNQIVKPSGVLQVLQECGRRQMAAQKPSYEDILKTGKALMLSRLDIRRGLLGRRGGSHVLAVREQQGDFPQNVSDEEGR